MITCIVPPVRYPRNCEKSKTSATIPCPAKAASPCINTPSTFFLSTSSRWACFALTRPTTTGFTTSKCDGFAFRVKWTIFSSNSLSADDPMWYLTSPDPPASSGLAGLPKNSEIMARKGFSIKLHKTFKRPRCAIPTTTSSRPNWLPRFRICSRAGMIDSVPSRPNRFVPTYLTARNFSKHSAAVIRSKMVFLPNTVKSVLFLICSIRFWIQIFCAGSCICMYSTPILPQYVFSRISIISRRVAVSRPNALSIKIALSQSFSSKP